MTLSRISVKSAQKNRLTLTEYRPNLAKIGQELAKKRRFSFHSQGTVRENLHIIYCGGAAQVALRALKCVCVCVCVRARACVRGIAWHCVRGIAWRCMALRACVAS